VEIRYALHQNVPVIPRSAVVTEDALSHVFVIDDTGVAKRRAIQLGFENDGQVEVAEGLSAGENVVTAGKGSLSDGMRVEVVGEEQVEDT
jgi:multidrug efflux pump subunit AcrA (membrane-fusion protein)